MGTEEKLESGNLFGFGPTHEGADADAENRSDGESDKARELDQFYTRPDVAAWCMARIREVLPWNEIDTWIEPSAGEGVFFRLLPEGRRRGFDIDDEHAGAGIEHQDFLTWDGEGMSGRTAYVGNPPFGRNCSLALAFFRRAVQLNADWICMVLPRTFEKASIQNKIPRGYVLATESQTIGEYAFVHNGEPYDVPCCFQIWRKLPPGEMRPLHDRVLKHGDFDFVGNHKDADFAFQRVGAKAGLASKEGLHRSWKSNHFIKVRTGVDPQELMRQLNDIQWDRIKGKTAGNPSISKGEMIAALEQYRRANGIEAATVPSPIADAGLLGSIG